MNRSFNAGESSKSLPYKWPGARTPLIQGLVSVFEALGFEDGKMNDKLEAGVEKVALYQKGGFWKHAARQLPNGKWASKLGPDDWAG